MDLTESSVNDKKHLGLESDSLVAQVFKEKHLQDFIWGKPSVWFFSMFIIVWFYYIVF